MTEVWKTSPNPAAHGVGTNSPRQGQLQPTASTVNRGITALLVFLGRILTSKGDSSIRGHEEHHSKQYYAASFQSCGDAVAFKASFGRSAHARAHTHTDTHTHTHYTHTHYTHTHTHLPCVLPNYNVRSMSCGCCQVIQ